jgi:hypothetical protein
LREGDVVSSVAMYVRGGVGAVDAVWSLARSLGGSAVSSAVVVWTLLERAQRIDPSFKG